MHKNKQELWKGFTLSCFWEEASIQPPQFWEKVSEAGYPTPSTITLLVSFLEVCGNSHFATGHYLEGPVV